MHHVHRHKRPSIRLAFDAHRWRLLGQARRAMAMKTNSEMRAGIAACAARATAGSSRTATNVQQAATNKRLTPLGQIRRRTCREAR